MPDLRRIFEKIVAWFLEVPFRASDLFVLAVYGAIVGFGIWHHEPWSDEAFPWMIARDTDLRGFLDIILHNWDRHPGLFYCILLPFAKLGFPYYTQAVLNILFALTAALLFLARAPFARIFKYLFLFSFFMIYEYSVITRTYMLSVLLIFCIAAFYPKRAEHPTLYALLVALLFQSDYMCFGMGVGLTLAFAIENKGKLFRDRQTGAAFLIMAASALMIFWTGHSLPHDHPDFGKVMPFSWEHLKQPLANAFFPFSNYGDHVAFKFIRAVSGGFLIVILVFISLIQTPMAALILGTSLGNLLFIFMFIQPGDYRHHGFIFISVLFALWISGTYPGKAEPAVCIGGPALQQKLRKARRGALFVIGLFIVLGLKNIVFVYDLEYSRYFSGAKLMAEAIKKIDSQYHIFEKGFVIVAKHRKSIGLLPYLPGVRFWNPCVGGYTTYYKVGKALAACDDLPPYEAVQLAKFQLGDLSKTFLLLERPLPLTEDADYRYREVFAVDKNVFGYMYEIFYLYYPLLKPSGSSRRVL